MFASKDIFLKSSGGYQISRSVRLRASATAYFSRTFGTATDLKKWTLSTWIKRGKLGDLNYICSSNYGDVNNYGRVYFTAADELRIDQADGGSVSMQWTSARLFRDPSAHLHLVVVFDTTAATSTDRLKVYCNGDLVSGSYAFGPLALNTSSRFNSATSHRIGLNVNGVQNFDGYLTEFNFIDGQALTPSSFGETNAVTGVWQPKKYGGTYGTNGFYLNFSDNSSNTATTIGKDYSGNGNNWTPNNISITAGVTYDSMLDSPTLYADGGNGRGNYATLNPLQAGVQPSDGNLKITGATAHRNVLSTQYLPASGLFYFEGFAPAIQRISFGLATSAFSLTTDAGSSSVFIGCYGDSSLLRVWDRGTNIFSLSSVAANDVFQIAIDCATGKAWFGRNNTWYNSTGATTGNPSAGTNQTFTITNPTDYAAELGVYDASSNSHINFGQRPFTYTPPTGFKALNTQNLPTPTISNGATVMAATLYTGTGSALTIANTVGSASFQPDLVWVKGRSGATDHAWYDAVRGVQLQLESNTTTAETTETTGLTAFGSTGFTVGALAQMNTNTATYVAWQWNAGGSTVTNTSGSISAQVRANATAGFSVVTYTGNGTNGSTIGHGLGVAPSMIIVKGRSTTDGWPVYHTSIANTQSLRLNTTAAVVTAGFWNNTTAGSSVFTVGGGTVSETNTTSATYVAYCFAAVAGYSAFGKYTGNGSTDGPFVFLGFRPRFLMIKNTTNAQPWIIVDTSRNTYNQAGDYLQPNSSAAENGGSAVSTATADDILSNGFKLRNNASSSGYTNANGDTYIYMAFAENPFKLSLAR